MCGNSHHTCVHSVISPKTNFPRKKLKKSDPKKRTRKMPFKFFPDEPVSSPEQEPPTNIPPSTQIIIGDPHYKTANKQRKTAAELKPSKDLKLQTVSIPDLVKDDIDENVKEILNSSSDLKPGVYEGGFKTWECTYDLINYIQDNQQDIFKGSSSPFRVLDLGCGSGLLGLCVLEFARRSNVDVRVDFQDYNHQVIDHITIPNTLLNFNDEITSTCRYYSGDWSSFTDLITKDNTTYDLILSSETIYNLDYFPKFIGVIKRTLGSSRGSCLYLAAKTFYFGVGGGTKAFQSMIDDDGELESQVVRVFKEGVKREIIRVQRKCTE